MEIDRFNFWENLPNMLKTISEAQYVAVDLEMSGIHVDKPRSTSVPKTKPTLQEAYNDARKAAMLYTIFQFGFTCINWDPKKNSYVTKTFNIPLHPGVVGDNDASHRLYSTMKRSITISTKSLGFLEENGFNFLDVFHRGVPYMSLAEFLSKEVSDFLLCNRPAEGEIFQVADLPKSSMEFRNDVEEKTSAYSRQLFHGAEARPVRIYGTSGRRLNGLQKRLVHQLLQDQFPHLDAFNRDGGHYLEIVQRRLPTSGSEKMRQHSKAVSKQVGARILWDAICGQHFVDYIDLEAVVGTFSAKFYQTRAELKQYEARLRKKSPILVGHNMLMDLCFLHTNFVDALPEPVQEFRAITRARLPRIVDTKYLFTRGGDEMSPDYSLAECFAALKSQQLPAVVSSHTYSQHLRHQAGYDSYMTAIVFLKKAYQLHQSRERLWYIASEDLGEGEARKSVPGQMTLGKLLKARDAAMATVQPPMPDVAEAPEVPQIPAMYKRGREAHRPASPVNLLEESDEEAVAKLAKFTILQPHSLTAAPATAPQTPEQSPEPEREPEREPEPEQEAKTEPKIPEWEEGRFWGKWGNRTRVGQFGFILYMPKMAGEKMAGEKMPEEGSGQDSSLVTG